MATIFPSPLELTNTATMIGGRVFGIPVPPAPTPLIGAMQRETAMFRRGILHAPLATEEQKAQWVADDQWRDKRIAAGLCACLDCREYCGGYGAGEDDPLCAACGLMCEGAELAICWRCKRRVAYLSDDDDIEICDGCCPIPPAMWEEFNAAFIVQYSPVLNTPKNPIAS